MATEDQHTGEDYPGEGNPHSHLFTIRVWQEVTGPAGTEWRGRLQHHPGGQVCYFRDWQALVSEIVSLLPGDDPASSAPEPAPAGTGGDSKRRKLKTDSDRKER